MSTLPVGGITDPGTSFYASVGPILSPDLTVVGQSPSSGSDVAARVTQISVQFDRPLDPFSLGFSDLGLVRVQQNGSITAVLDDTSTEDESLDATGTILTVTLTQPLAPGNYQLVLSGNAFLFGTDGSMLANIGVDTPLGDFSVSPPAPTLADATDLGALSATVTSAIGQLDLQHNPHDVGLYRFEVTPQYALSQVGIEVSARQGGSALDAAILLMDSNGRSIAYNDVGRPGNAFDPYFFQGLKPGTYYVAVVGRHLGYGLTGEFDAANPPYAPTDANPAGGSYTLQLVADPGETPAAQIGFGLIRQDPLDPNPSGFSLQFNAPLDVTDSSGHMFDVMSWGVQVIDSRGRSWPVAGVSYNEAESTLTYVFRQELPQGSYRIQIPSTGGLVDLSGHRPTAKRSDGVLGTFTIARTPVAAPPNNLGMLYPDDISGTVDRRFVIAPGATLPLRFVVLYGDTYKLTTTQSGGILGASILDPSGPADDGPPAPRLVALGANGETLSTMQQFDAGVHVLTLTNPGSRPVTFRFQLSIGAYHWESLLQNGIGQGPALGLRLIAPTFSDNPSSSTTTSGAAPEASPGPAANLPAVITIATSGLLPGPATPAVPASTSSAALAPALAAGSPTGLFLTVAGQPIGSTAFSAHPAATVPGTSSGHAESSVGFGQSLSPSGQFMSHSDATYTPPAEDQSPIEDAAPEDEVLSSGQEADLMAAIRQPTDSLVEDLSDVGGFAAETPLRLDGSLPDGPTDISWSWPIDRTLPEEAKVIDPGLGLGLIAAVAVHYRETIRRWFSRWSGRESRQPKNRVAPSSPRRPSSRSQERILSSVRSMRSESRERLIAH